MSSERRSLADIDGRLSDEVTAEVSVALRTLGASDDELPELLSRVSFRLSDERSGLWFMACTSSGERALTHHWRTDTTDRRALLHAVARDLLGLPDHRGFPHPTAF